MEKHTNNRQMQRMLEPARERLKNYSVKELCQKGGLQFDTESSEFLVPSMGRELRVRYPDFTICDELDMWQYLTILQYMDTADGSPLSGQRIGLSQMRGGLSRGISFDRDISAMLESGLKAASAEAVQAACLKLGGTLVNGRADVSASIPYAPMFPVLFSFWEGDEEFPPSGKVLVDEMAEHYLTIEAAGGACCAVVKKIMEQVQRL